MGTGKPLNLQCKGIKILGGHLHPLAKMRTCIRQIFLEMGFQEMSTNNYIESTFWNFDALFQPQHHPSRDTHDTFYISSPSAPLRLPDEQLIKRIERVHSIGDFGSLGHGYFWDRLEANKNILRTHATAVTARKLYELAKTENFVGKYFSIDRLFRNESLDATHLAEFHQIEGFVIDYDLSLANLMGYVQYFFDRMGFRDVKFKPAYNPYIEPSMEIFAYHPSLKKWIEIGNSGIFRPEVLLPLKFPENIRVIAWGFSLERPAMIKYKISDTRQLFGHRCDLNLIYDNSICRL